MKITANETSFTPGPWTYFVGNANGRGLVRIETSLEAVEAGLHIASMPRGARSEANACLIAAAPEMFEALALYVKYAPLSGDMALFIRATQAGGKDAQRRADSLVDYYEHLNDARDKGIAALAKAVQK